MIEYLDFKKILAGHIVKDTIILPKLKTGEGSTNGLKWSRKWGTLGALYNVSEDPSFYCETEEEVEEEVLRSAFWSLFLLQTLGSLSSLTFSSLMALFDRQLDAGYKIGYLIAWILGGRGRVLLVLCLQFASLASGKTSSSTVAPAAAAGGPVCWFKSCEDRPPPTRCSCHAFVQVY